MIYRAIGLMSGSSLDGLDIVFAELDDSKSKWGYEIKAAACYEYSNDWKEKLQQATALNAKEYLLLNNAYGRYIGESVNRFIETHHLHHQVQLIASHGHTTFHNPTNGLTEQLGNGAIIAATTGINVVSDLRQLDVALGGQGAPIVPMGEKLLFAETDYFLNLGGIANLSKKTQDGMVAFDICPANRVLNMLAQKQGKAFDEGGRIAASGKIYTPLLTRLNTLDYYARPFPKSLSNEFGTDIIFPLFEAFDLTVEDAMRTCVEHITQQLTYAVNMLNPKETGSMIITGGGAFNSFLVKRIKEALQPFNITVTVPDANLVQYKEALIMALLGILRWREENTVLNTVTGATKSSIGGCVWIGQDA